MSDKLNATVAVRHRTAGLTEEPLWERRLLYSEPSRSLLVAFAVVAADGAPLGRVYVLGFGEKSYRPLLDIDPRQSLDSPQACADVPVVYCLLHRWSDPRTEITGRDCEGIVRVDLSTGTHELWNPWLTAPHLSPSEICSASGDRISLVASEPGRGGSIRRTPLKCGVWSVTWSTRRAQRVRSLGSIWF